MIDRERVIDGLDRCKRYRYNDNNPCDGCPYRKTNEIRSCCIDDLIEDAFALLKADQTYLQEQDEKIKKLHLLLNAKLSAQPLIQKLTESLQRIADIAGEYDDYPTRNGLEWVCIEIQEIAMSGLSEIHPLREEGEEAQ